MNIFTAIEEVTYFNTVNKPFVKAEIDYKKQHAAGPIARKLGSKPNKKSYSDAYKHTSIKPVSNAMKLHEIKPLNIVKRIPLVMQSTKQVPNGDEEQYKFLLSATKEQLAQFSPVEYFGCRTDGTYVYDFNRRMIFRIIPDEYIEKYEDPIYIREGVYVDVTTGVVMGLSEQYERIWMDTTKYQPINPNMIHLFDINNSTVYHNEQEDITRDLETQIRQQRERLNELQKKYRDIHDIYFPDFFNPDIYIHESEPEPEPEQPEPKRYKVVLHPYRSGTLEPPIKNPFLERRLSSQESISNEDIDNLVKEIAYVNQLTDNDAEIISSSLKEANNNNYSYMQFKQLLNSKYNGNNSFSRNVLKGINNIFNKMKK